MLGKLIKYEYRSTARIFIPLYIALVLVAVVNRIFRIGDISLGFGLSSFVIAGLFVSLIVITIMMIIQRFNKNLLGDEGYLMFTLPVSSSKLIFSKLIISVFWTLISSIVACIAVFILSGETKDFMNMLNDMSVYFGGLEAKEWVQFILGIVIFVMSYISFIFEVYLSLSSAQLPIFNKHRGIISFAVFFVINVVISIISSQAGRVLKPVDDILLGEGLIGAYTLIICSVLFILIKYILEKHLNLE